MGVTELVGSDRSTVFGMSGRMNPETTGIAPNLPRGIHSDYGPVIVETVPGGPVPQARR